MRWRAAGQDEDLPALRLEPPPVGTVLVEGSAYSGRTPTGAELRYDAATQSVDLSLPASAFVADRARTQPALRGPPTISPGAFLNYDFSTRARRAARDETAR